MDQFRSAWDRDAAIHSMAAWYRAEPLPVDGAARVSNPTLVILAENDRFIPAAITRATNAPASPTGRRLRRMALRIRYQLLSRFASMESPAR